MEKLVPLRSFFKHKTVEIENWAFRFTYRIATTVHLAFFTLMTSHIIFGEPMECEIDGLTRNFAMGNDMGCLKELLASEQVGFFL
jgi:hypothetical protein